MAKNKTLILFSRSCMKHYSSLRNFLTLPKNKYHMKYGNIEIFAVTDTTDPVFDSLNLDSYAAIVCDESTLSLENVAKSKPIKFLMSGNIHASEARIRTLRESIDRADFVLSPYLFSGDDVDSAHFITRRERTEFIFFPHHVNSRMVEIGWEKDFSIRTKDIFLSDELALDETYPFRKKIVDDPELFNQIGGLNFIARRDDADFIKVISEYKAAITCGSKFSYATVQHFEIMAAKSLLIMNTLKSRFEMEILGFRSGYNCYAFGDIHNDEIWKSQLKNTLVDINTSRSVSSRFEERMADVARNGNFLVGHRHTTEKRLVFLDVIVDRIVRGVWNNFDQFEYFMEPTSFRFVE